MEELDRRAIVRVKQQIAHLFEPNPWIYWSDLLSTSALGWAAFVLAFRVESALATAACLFVAIFAHYRGLVFTHELEHLPAGSLPGFSAAWHLLEGMPCLVPHFVYRGVHRIHHSARYYGTAEDPEYIAFVRQGSLREPVRLLGLALIFPLMLAVRYLVLSPLSLCSTKLRRWVQVNASSLVMKLDYQRQLPSGAEMRAWRIEEITTSLYAWTVVLLVAFGPLPLLALGFWWIVMGGAMFANCVRGLAATHRYDSAGEQLSFDAHIGDSFDLQKFSLLHLLIAPLGLSLHATHHVFPSLPYYALPRAQALLVRECEGEGKPLAFYAAGQWSSLTASIPRLIRLTRARNQELSGLQKNPRELRSLRNASSASKSSG
jgi:fatty acid desaturase